MFYIIQKHMFKEIHFNSLIEVLLRGKLEYEVVKFIPFSHDVEGTLPGRKDIWVWGSVSMAHAISKYGWNPGSLYNSNHDFEVYSKYYDMLNSDAKVIKFTDPIPDGMDWFFARPTGDTKAFKSEMYSRESWNDLVRMHLPYQTDDNRSALIESKVLLASPKDIQQEVRCWVVNGKVVTASRYKMNDNFSTCNYDYEEGFVNFAQSMVDKFQPAKAFVIDVCLIDEKYKVVEVNCINCSGFYQANMFKLISAIEDNF